MLGLPSLRPVAVLALLVVAAATGSSVGGAVTADAAGADALAATASTLADDPSGRFGDRVRAVERGDVLEIRVDDAKGHRVVLGSDDAGFKASFRVTSNSATIRLNTYKAGWSHYDWNEVVWAEDGSIADLRVDPGSLDQPLGIGRYSMAIYLDGTESDVGAFDVTERSTDYSSGWALPAGFEVDEDTTADDVVEAGENRTDNLSIASGDWLALEVNASGLYGILEKDGLDGDDGISVTFVQRNPLPNADANTFEGDSAAHLLAAPADDRFFLLVDTSRHGIEPGHVYDAEFAVAPESGLVDEEERLETTFRVLEREAQVFYSGRKLVANASGTTTVAGNATMVAGTTFRVRARSVGDHPFLETKTVELDNQSAFETTFDLSSYPPGTNFSILIPETGLSVPATVGDGEPSTATPTRVATTISTPTPTPTATPTPTVSYETNTPLAARTVTASDGQSGFGLAGPAVALLAALVACRRWGA